MKIEELLDLLADGRKGYQEAGNKTKDHAMANFLLQLCQEREDLWQALKDELERRMPAPKEQQERIFGAGLRPAWIDIREKLAQAHGADILTACERSEGYIFDGYGEVITPARQPQEVQDLLIQQQLHVRATLYALERSNTSLEWTGRKRSGAGRVDAPLLTVAH